MQERQQAQLDQEPLLVVLGDAKELTLGPPLGTVVEDSPLYPFRMES